MIGAFAFLIFTTTRNRVASQLRRLKQPRYAIGLVLGLLYFYSLFFRRALTRGTGTNPLLGVTVETIAPLFVVLLVSGIWLFGGDRSALAFTEAEVSMLLTAPVSRRGLIIYKLVRAQLLIALNAVIWVFLLRRGSTAIPAGLTTLAMWSIFTTFSLHRMGAALLRAKQVEYRSAGKGRNWFPVVIVMAIAAAMIISSESERGRLANAPDPFAFLKTFMAILQEPLARTLLLPFRLVIAPIFARGAGAWAAAMLPALSIVLLHVAWVLRSETAFEEAAAAASEEQAKRIAAMRARRSGVAVPTGKSKTRTLSLSPTGLPLVAIAWKNMIALRRTFQSGMLLRMTVMMVLATAAIGWKAGDVAVVAGVMALAMALVATVVFVPGFRNDLRSDMLQLPFLKSLPLRGSDLVIAEILSGTLTLAAVQFLLLAVAYAAFGLSAGANPVSVGVRTGLLVVSPIVLVAIDGVFFSIANGAAVLFPAWLRLGHAGPGGVEVMGQAMLSMIAALIALLLLLLFPVVFGSVGFFILRANTAAAVTGACLIAGVSLMVETYAVILGLGRAFERAEPQQIT